MAKAKKENIQTKLHNGLHEIVEKMIADIEAGAGTWIKSWSAPNGFPQNFISKKEYRGFNFFYLNWIMETKGYTAPYFLTFNQAKELGGSVKKGAKSISVYFYKMMTYIDNNPIEDNVIVKDEDKPKLKIVPLLREYKVFNIEDCECIEYSLSNTPKNDNQRYADTDDFIKHTYADIVHGGNQAFFSPSTDHVQMPEIGYFKDSDNYYATLLHELTHWSGAKSRLDRTKGKRFGDKDYAFEELVAELGSAFLCSHLGIKLENNQHPEYLQSWVNSLRENPQILWKAGSKSQEAFDFIRELSERNKSYTETKKGA